MRNLMMVLAMVLVVLSGITSAMASEIYVTKKGDTVSKIARQYKVSNSDVMKLAGISDPRKLQIGKKLNFNKKSAEVAPVKAAKLEQENEVKITSLTSSATMTANPASSENNAVSAPINSNNNNLVVDKEIAAQAAASEKTSVKEDPAAVSRRRYIGLIYAKPPKDGDVNAVESENHFKNNTAPFAWGKSFNEIGVTAGGYTGKDGLLGGYFIAEGNHWNEVKDAGRNISLLGAFLMYEPGKIKSGYHWNKIKVLYQPGLYEVLDDHQSYHLLIKPRIGASFDSGTEKSETNLTYGGYLEFDKIFNPLNRAGLMADAMIEKRKIGNEGQFNPRLFYEKGFGDEGKSVMLSAGPIWHIAPDKTETGVAGALSFRMPVGNDFAWQIALTADVTKQSTTVGGFISGTWDDIMHVFQTKGR